MSAEPMLLDWVRHTDRDLARLGGDPDMRLDFCGHSKRVLPQWLPTVGLWTRYSLERGQDRPLFDFDDRSRAQVPVTRMAYRQFKYRNGLMNRPEFAARFGPDPWAQAEICWMAHHAVQSPMIARSGVGLSVGRAAHKLWESQLSAHRDPNHCLGMLPAEIVGWAGLFADFLQHYRITVDHWGDLDDDAKDSLWHDTPDDGQPWDLRRVFCAPARLHLPGYEPAVSARGTAPA